MKYTAIINVAIKLFPNRDIWTLTKEEISKVMEILEDYY